MNMILYMLHGAGIFADVLRVIFGNYAIDGTYGNGMLWFVLVTHDFQLGCTGRS